MQLDDLEVPLFYENDNLDHIPGENSMYSKISTEESSCQISRRTHSPRRHALAGRQKHVTTDLHENQGILSFISFLLLVFDFLSLHLVFESTK